MEETCQLFESPGEAQKHGIHSGYLTMGLLEWWGHWEACVDYFSKAQWSAPVLHLQHLPHPCCCANLFPCLENDPQAVRIPFRPLSQFCCRGHQFPRDRSWILPCLPASTVSNTTISSSQSDPTIIPLLKPATHCLLNV